MATEFISMKDVYKENEGFKESNMDIKTFDDNYEISDDFNMDSESKIRKCLYFCFKLSHMGYWAFILFTSLVIIIGALIVYFYSPKPNITCQFDFKRTMKSSISFSSQPSSIAVGDINKDGQMDIIVSNFGTNTIGIFLSQDDGTFADQQTYSTGVQSQPISIVVNDFNNDSYLDIAVANYGVNNIGIFLGNQNGTFNKQKIISIGNSRPRFLSSNDFNNDSRMDLAVVNFGTNNIGILLGFGDGSFYIQTTYSTGYDSFPCSLALADFNNDSKIDIVVTNNGTNNIGIFFGYGNGSFTNQQIYSTSLQSNPSSVAVGDFNNDNYLDIVVANSGTSNVGIFLGIGNGSFLTQTTYSINSNSYPKYIAVGDINGDTGLDIVISDPKNDQIYVFLGDGNGAFVLLTTYDDISKSSPFGIAVTDFNHDNNLDIAVVNYGTNNIIVLSNYSIKPSVRLTNYPVGTPSITGTVVIGDFNNDNIVDFVSNTFNSLIILIGLGDGTFSNEATFLIGNKSNIQYITAGDLNNDNCIDIIIGDLGYKCVGVFLGLCNGTFATIKTYSTGVDSNPYWVTLADVNNDTYLDIVSANRDSHTIGIFIGNGKGTFANMISYSTGNDSLPTSVSVKDINNDNYVDILVTDWNGNIIIFLGSNNGNFIFSNVYLVGAGFGTFSLVLADFNDDNNLDFVVVNAYASSISIFLGFGNGTFMQKISYLTSSSNNPYPYYAMVADFNNDNISDIAVTNYGTDEVSVLSGVGDGTFQYAAFYSTGLGSKPYGITVANFGDNVNEQLKIIVALWGTGIIAVLNDYNAAWFVGQTIYSTGSASQPFSTAIGDFNNDHRPDIVVANSGRDNLGIYLGSDDGTFSIEMTYSLDTDSYPQFITTYDVNNDNKLDLISVNSKENSISVILGYGNGSFAKQMLLSSGSASYPYAITLGDFNNDSRVDLLVANSGTNNVGIFYGYDYTSFKSIGQYFHDDSSAPLGIVTNDFNNDNYLDTAITFSETNEIGIILGYNNGNFTNMIVYSTGNNSQPWGIDVSDFNNDNISDIVVANSGSNNICVFLGFGNGSFATMMLYSTGESSSPIGVAVHDLNNDGQKDIVVANSDSDTIGIFYGLGNGNFSTINLYPTGKGSSPRSVIIADIDGDDRIDILVANFKGDNIGILLGNGNGTFQEQITLSTGDYSNPYSIAIGDFNGDGLLDIATANWNTNNVGILLRYKNGTFAPIVTYSTSDGSLPRCVKVGDFNNDNILDIVVANSGTKNIVVLFGFGDGRFLLGTVYSTSYGAQPMALAVGNFNNDIELDVAVAAAGSLYNAIEIFVGDIGQLFAGITTYSTGNGSNPHSVAVNDLNNDGWLDIVIANYGTNNVGILFGSDTEIFSSIQTYSTGLMSAPYSVAIADFNNDYQLDIVVTNSQTDNIIIFFGSKIGTFTNGTTYSTGIRSRPYIVTTGDLNNDNITDIAVANSGTSNIFLLYGYGNGTFGNERSYPLGYEYQPYSVTLKDLNGDNWTDIVVACYGTDHIEILLKMC